MTELRAKKRLATAAEVQVAQEELVSKAAKDDAAGTVRLPVDEAAKLVAPQLQSKKAEPSAAVVLGSPTQLKQSQQVTPAPKPEAEGEGKEKRGREKGEEKGRKPFKKEGRKEGRKLRPSSPPRKLLYIELF